MSSNLVAPVGVLGFGVEGQSTFNYLVRSGIKEIVVMDKNPVKLPETPAGVNVKVFSGEGYLDGLKDCVTVVRSAGVYPMSQDLFKFQMNGGLMTSQIQLFLEQTKSKKVVGVTGTLGKGSTVSMISHILTKCGVENDAVVESLFGQLDEVAGGDGHVIVHIQRDVALGSVQYDCSHGLG